ncbi:cellobiose 2-epimerase [Flavobacterium noncentrifugens]|uniref:Cellobiose 2-epimerase n=1 Tax=Flavobacterium noncentrifugens TaxID=1128970 RepID=A0A1G8WGM2_9FLAO|nr:AGE family epimerase/isomerase [Flavobacterium noncentrifugens]GEP50919.1 cellobiose 2-epimerase [Flavobacterium noncentrifugens]SDJ77293.1 mannobiose 2-epimerase [Flavobacterium noncentrifugens]
MTYEIEQLRKEMTAELDAILLYWEKQAVDNVNGGFLGQIDCNEIKITDSEKGSVLNARILWTFAAAYQNTKNKVHQALAERAFHYLANTFYDPEFGGIFWSVDHLGHPKDTKNQIYAIAFAIYGLSEYYAISDDPKTLEMAICLYEKIQKYSYDPINKGYLEAFTRDWKPLDDLRLSDKDANEKKTMNTHLHIIEAYANLYKIWPDADLKNIITELLETIETHFINTKTGHLKLFFDEQWKERPDVISYGHDIEAAWLLLQCAEVTQDEKLISRFRDYAILMTDATKEGIDSDGGLWYEFDPETKTFVAEKHWWPQAELLIGFYNAWQLTRNKSYLDVVFTNWAFIKNHIIDSKNSEWIWGVYEDYSPILKDKAGFWKCPYHNGRACLELIHRIENP